MKTAAVHRCSEKFCYIHRKTPVLESIFNVLRPATLLKRDSNIGVFQLKCRNFYEYHYARTPLLAVLKQVESHQLLMIIN